MNLHTHVWPRVLEARPAIVAAIAAAAMLSVATSSPAAAGKMGGGVKAPSPTMAVKIGSGSFNQVANDVRPSKPPSVAKEPCRGRHRPNRWPNHQH
ncbi:MAG: hypothetical protein K2Z80_21880 [Xanthobacteraceae bacterium]|nr:hypothetical protein [Xanthobacteraceae bacterium]